MDKTAEWLARDDVVLGHVLNRVFDLVALEGQGSWIIDVDGSRYLDFTCGIGVTSIGHCHPEVVAAIQDQASRLLHTSVVLHHERVIELAERMRELVSWMPYAQTFFCNSGAEAVDGALKMARRLTGKPGVIAFRRAFHGRTFGATSLTTAKGWYRTGYEPLMSGVHIAPYAVPFEAGDAETASAEALVELDRILALDAPDPAIGLIIIEPVLGEGGYVPAPKSFLEGLRQRADEHEALLCFDEVQSGIARTGKWFAAEHYGVYPDILLFAKAIASGLPLGGFLARQELFNRWPTAQHGSTFGGNPLSCAAALATLDVIEKENLRDRAKQVGSALLEGLRSVDCDYVRDVRGLGLMIGVQFSDSEAAKKVQESCLAQGLLILACGPDDDTLRLIPPLNLSDEEVSTGQEILHNALRAL